MFFRRKPKSIQPIEMTPDEILTIKEYACDVPGTREAAMSIHYKYIPLIGVRGNIYQKFLAECDSPCPDLALRFDYREAVINA